MDEGELLLGDSVVHVVDVVRAVLTRAVGEARRLAGGAAVDLLVLTHPADWGAVRTRVLRQAGHGLAHELVLVPEPVAAAVYHAAMFAPAGAASGAGAPGAALAVLDLGGGTVDASVVRRGDGGAPGSGRPGFQVLATKGDPTFGGTDIDHALLQHVGSLVGREDPDGWQELVAGREIADRRRRRVLWQDIRGAKETLSRHTYTDVPLPPPFPDAHVTRADLEGLIAEPLGRAAELVVDTVREAGLRPDQLAGVFLVGGSSRIPLVARLVHERTGVVPTSIDQPETVVARGALRAVSLDPDRTGNVVAARSGPPVAAPPAAHRPGGPPGPAAGHPAFPGPAFPPATPVGGPAVSPLGSQFPAAGTLPPPTHAVPSGFAGPGGPAFPGTGPLPAGQRSAGPAPVRPGRSSTPWLVVGGVVALAAVVGAALVFWPRGDATTPGGTAQPGTSATQPSGRQIAQYEYIFTLPGGWSQSGGSPEERKVQLKPDQPRTERDLVAVQEYLLGYDSTANRQRAVDELRQVVAQAGPRFSGFTAEQDFAGKNVSHYQESLDGATVDWYVLFEGRTQVSVGCQYSEAGQNQVRSACEEIVRTLDITG